MVKQRVATADVAAEVACLKARGIEGMRVTNVYDVSSRIYVLKLARSGDDGDKVLLLIESGMRFHSIDTMPPKDDAPSNFSLKLRKHIRSRRLLSVRQLGVDRIVQLSFSGSGTNGVGYHLLLEFFAGGNIILTDDNYQVLTLLRSHRDDAKGVAIMARHLYPIHTVRLRVPISPEKLDEELNKTLDGTVPEDTSESIEKTADSNEKSRKEQKKMEKKKKKAKSRTLKDAVTAAMPYGNLAAEHCIIEAKLDPSRVLSVASTADSTNTDTVKPLEHTERIDLLQSIRKFEKWLDSCEHDENAPGGCIIYRLKSSKTDAVEEKIEAEIGQEEAKSEAYESKIEEVYEDFHPLIDENTPFASLKGLECIASSNYEEQSLDPKKKYIKYFDTFDKASAEFFGKIADQRAAEQRAAQQRNAKAKLQAVRRDHALRIEGLEREALLAEYKAGLIESNLIAVDAAINAVRDALSEGMDWGDLWNMIQEEKVAGNPVAQLVDSLQLDSNIVTILLDHVEDETNTFMKGKYCKVKVDITLTAHANARSYYDSRRWHLEKLKRTKEANETAIAAAEKKALDALNRAKTAGKHAAALASAGGRKPYWWERFNWFISSENYLVLSGRDAQQNELLVKRYLKKGDIYVHADLHGASSTIIKNPNPGDSIPPLTLAEAGAGCVCRSAAWDAKVVTSAWWVHSTQVSKTAPSGEYLTTGSFMIRGRKNYLPPQPLIMGIAWLFKLEEGSIARHLGERAPRGGLFYDDKNREEDSRLSEYLELSDGNDASSNPLQQFMDTSIDGLNEGMKHKETIEEKGQGIEASFSRYGLLHPSDIENGISEPAANSSGIADNEPPSVSKKEPKRHLSAKERQLIKKGLDPKDSKRDSQTEINSTSNSRIKNETSKGMGERPVQRAKAGKKMPKGKKAAFQWEDSEDEREREIAASLYGNANAGKKDRKQRKEERKTRLAARKAAASSVPQKEVTQQDIALLTARMDINGTELLGQSIDIGELKHRKTSLMENRDIAETDFSASKNISAATDTREGTNGNALDGTNDSDNLQDSDIDEDEIAALMAEEGVDMLESNIKERLTQLDELTGCPKPGDVLLAAIPVCAPYSVLSTYTYRVKLVPGTLKKGKAYKQAVEMAAGKGAPSISVGVGKAMTSLENAVAGEGPEMTTEDKKLALTQRERALIKAVPDVDGINAIIGGVRLQVAGLQRLTASKKIKKGNAKNAKHPSATSGGGKKKKGGKS